MDPMQLQIALAQQAEQERQKMLEDQLMRDLETAKKDPAVDLSGLIALSGDQLATQAASQQAGRQMAVEGGNEKRLDDLYDALVGNTGSGVGKTSASASNQVKKQEAIDERAGLGRIDRFEKDFQTDIERSLLDPLNKRKEQFSIMQEAIDSGNFINLNQVLSQFARGISGEKGVLTDRDVVRVMPSTFKNDVAAFKTYLGSEKAKSDPEVRQALLEMMRIARENASKVYRDYINSKEEIYKKRRAAKEAGAFQPGGIGDQAFFQARESLKNFAGEPDGGDKAAAPKGAPPLLDLNSVQAELKKRKGG